MNFKILKISSLILMVFSSGQLTAGKYKFVPSEDKDEPGTVQLLSYEKKLNFDEINENELKAYYFHDLVDKFGDVGQRISIKKVGDIPRLKGKITGEFYTGDPVLVGFKDGGAKINEKNIITILIHGTFVPLKVFGDAWPNFSKYRGKLAGETFGGGQVYSFLWSGKNNLARRKLAADKLARYLAYFYKKDQNSIINLVGHSHGGNVAKLALNYASELIPRRPIVDNLLTLATPNRSDIQLESKDYFNYFVQVSSPADGVVSLAGFDFKTKRINPPPHHKDLAYADLNIVIEGFSHSDLNGISVFEYLKNNFNNLKERYPHKGFVGRDTIMEIRLPKFTESTNF